MAKRSNKLRSASKFLTPLASLIILLVIVGVSTLGIFNLNKKASSPLPAFPGAEGFGSTTKGGRGGRVIKVTNLNESGPGSLREALVATGPRIVVFEVGGVIDLYNDNIGIDGEKNSYLTVLGQTAPGEGITVKGPITIRDSHDIIIRYLKIRPPDPGLPLSEDTDALAIDGNSNNIILDHNSFSWATDENLQFYTAAGSKQNISNITFQWNIIGEGDTDSTHPESNLSTGSHSMGQLLSNRSFSEIVGNISLHHNLYIHNNARNPLMQYGSSPSSSSSTGIFRFINNVVYNWGSGATEMMPENGGVIRFDIIGNYYRTGPTSTVKKYKQPIWCYGDSPKSAGSCSLYTSGNLFQDMLGPTSEPTPFLWAKNGATNSISSKSSPHINDGVTINSATQALDLITQKVGVALPAYSLLDRSKLTRDTIDTRLINELKAASGKIGIDSDGVRRYPTATYKTHQLDSDNDGIPDSWESAYGTNPSVVDSHLDSNGNGYSNVEDYANFIISEGNSLPTPNPTVPVATMPPVVTPLPTVGPSPVVAGGEYALLFNGSGYVSVGDPSNGSLDFGSTGDFTLEGFIKTSYPDKSQTIIHKGAGAPNIAGYWFFYNAAYRELRLAISDGVTRINANSIGNLNLADGKWHHVAVAVNRSGLAYFYLDGVEVGTESVSGLAGKSLSSGNSFEISKSNDPAYSVYGLLDTVRVWKSFKSKDQLNSLRTIGVTNFTSDLVGYWKFNEGTGTTAYDKTGYGNNGQVNNTVWIKL